MNEFKFLNGENEYVLSKENLTYIDNEEVLGFELKDVINNLKQGGEKVYFDYEYFTDKCDECGAGKKVDDKHYRFLEYHFYIFTKEGKYIISNISTDFQNTSFDSLLKNGKIDNSYIVSVMVCEDCKTYNIAIEQCDM